MRDQCTGFILMTGTAVKRAVIFGKSTEVRKESVDRVIETETTHEHESGRRRGGGSAEGINYLNK